MDKKFCIFDMDGTLIDSMPAWKNLDIDYLSQHGITPPDDIHSKTAAMTMLEAAEYFISLGVSGRAEEIVDELNERMRFHYRTTISAQPGVEKYLEMLREKGAKCCVATATNSDLAKECLQRLDLLKFFEFVISCDDIGTSKEEPDIYLISAEKLGAVAEQTAVFEDVVYAAKSAKKADFYLVGCYDPNGSSTLEQLQEICDECITDYFEAAKLG